MSAIEKIGLLENRFLRGDVSAGELPLELEALLWQVGQGELDEGAIRKIMNDLELYIFTLPADQLAVSVGRLLKDARTFIEARASAD